MFKKVGKKVIKSLVVIIMCINLVPTSMAFASTTRVTGITLSNSSLSIAKGNATTLTATITPNTATNKAVKWESSNTKVAKVDSNGKITAVSKGTATITCKAKDTSKKKATCKVTVTSTSTSKITGITLNKSSLSIAKGNTSTLIATIAPNTATNKAVEWKSSNKKVAKVDSNGKITAVSKGTATITCTASDGSKKKSTCKVTVTK